METRLTPRIAAMIIGGLEQTVNRRSEEWETGLEQ